MTTSEPKGGTSKGALPTEGSAEDGAKVRQVAAAPEEQWPPPEEDDWVSPELANAASGKFIYAESLAFWQALAEGRVSGENAEWVTLIAKRVIEANNRPSRTAAMSKAVVGLSYSGKHHELRQLVKGLKDHDATMAQMLAAARMLGLVDEQMEDDTVRETIRRELTR